MPIRVSWLHAALAALVLLALALGGCGQDEDAAAPVAPAQAAAPAPAPAAALAPAPAAVPAPAPAVAPAPAPAPEASRPEPGANPFAALDGLPEAADPQERTVAAAAPQAATPAPRIATPAPRAAVKKAAPAPRGAATLQDATALFAPFARDWLGTISRNLRHTASDMEIAVDGDGTVVARFVEVDPGSLDMRVKPSASGGAACPFVGVMRYLEHRYESRAPSEAQARSGPFTLVATRRVTEIFRYVSGRWTN